MSFAYRFSLSAALFGALLLLPACHQDRAERVQPAAQAAGADLPGTALLKTELFFGRGKSGGGTVTEAEWQAFLDAELTPRFPAGLTVLDAQGQWRGEDGKIVKEPSKVVVLLHEDTAAVRKALEDLIAAYKKQFAQEAVLRVTQKVHASF